MYLTKKQDGSYIPSSDEDKLESNLIPVGSEIEAKITRSAKFHRKAILLLNLGFENQDKIKFFEIYRKVVTIKAGYFDMVPSEKEGEIYCIPKSISYEKMSPQEFSKWYADVLRIISEELKTSSETIQKELDEFY